MVVPDSFFIVQWFALGINAISAIFYVVYLAFFKRGSLYVTTAKLLVSMTLLALAVAGLLEQGFIHRPSDPADEDVWWARWAVYSLTCGIFSSLVISAYQMFTPVKAVGLAVFLVLTNIAALFSTLSDAEEARWVWLIVGALFYVAASFMIWRWGKSRIWLKIYISIFWTAYVAWLILHEITGFFSLTLASVIYLIHDTVFTKIAFFIITEFIYRNAALCPPKDRDYFMKSAQSKRCV